MKRTRHSEEQIIAIRSWLGYLLQPIDEPHAPSRFQAGSQFYVAFPARMCCARRHDRPFLRLQMIAGFGNGGTRASQSDEMSVPRYGKTT